MGCPTIANRDDIDELSKLINQVLTVFTNETKTNNTINVERQNHYLKERKEKRHYK